MKSLNQLYLCAVLSIFSAHQANSSESTTDRSLQEKYTKEMFLESDW